MKRNKQFMNAKRIVGFMLGCTVALATASASAEWYVNGSIGMGLPDALHEYPTQ